MGSVGGPPCPLPVPRHLRLISTLREYPTTEDFVYLRRMDTNASVYDPYALEVAPYASVDQRDFYTLSVRGMTHYLDGVSADFASEWGGGEGQEGMGASSSAVWEPEGGGE